jgi:hypothetical protein
VKLIDFQPTAGRIEAACRYSGFLHKRKVQLDSQHLTVVDEIEGPPGEHVCEQVWQLGPASDRVSLSFSADPVWRASKVSPAYGMKTRGESLSVTVKGELPSTIVMRLSVNGSV